MNEVKQKSIRSYLLGTLSESERAEFEKSLLTDDTLYEELLIHEDELTDEYIANELSAEEQESYQTYFLSTPERQETLRFALSLQRYVGAANQPQRAQVEPADVQPRQLRPRVSRFNLFQKMLQHNPTVAYAVAAGVLLAVISVAWLVIGNLKQSPTGSGDTVLVTLTPGSVRGSGETKVVQVTPNIGFVQMRLLVPPDDYTHYSVELLSSANDNVFEATDLPPVLADSSRLVEFVVPATLLKRDDYQVKLAGRTSRGNNEDVAGYYLRVLK